MLTSAFPDRALFSPVPAQPMGGPVELPATAKEIRVVLGHQYGQQVVLPASPEAEIFCQIAGTKTLPQKLIGQIKALGYRVLVVPTQPEEL